MMSIKQVPIPVAEKDEFAESALQPVVPALGTRYKIEAPLLEVATGIDVVAVETINESR